ncbi:MAG: hypothetical protein AB1746_04265 [Candidatus Zixiibacteriota bacterium]
MKKLILLLLIVFAILASCADDIIIPQQSPLRGAYRGSYTVVENYNTGGATVTHFQYVDWTFTDQKFFCDVNDTISSEIWLCNFSGGYKLENVLVFSDTLVGVQTCNKDFIPVGDMQLIRYQNEEGLLDSMEISQYDIPHTMLKTLMLYPVD